MLVHAAAEAVGMPGRVSAGVCEHTYTSMGRSETNTLQRDNNRC